MLLATRRLVNSTVGFDASRHTEAAQEFGEAIMGIEQFSDNFEPPDRDWFLTGGAGFDRGKGLAHKGDGNAWVRATSGWNAINRFHDVQPGSTYTVGAWLRLSPSVTDGYFSVREARERNGEGQIITQRKLVGPGPTNPDNADYNEVSFSFDTGDLSTVLIYVGLWGNGQDAWIQIDDFVLETNF
jgi:hypothetical protein